MKIIVSDRETIEAGILVKTAYVLISITDPEQKRTRIPKQTGLRDVLHLSFNDAEPTTGMKLPLHIRLMTEDTARHIWRFIEKHKANVGTIVVQCEQGMSRSPAVAAAISKKLGLNENKFWQEYQPNRYIYSLMCKTCPES